MTHLHKFAIYLFQREVFPFKRFSRFYGNLRCTMPPISAVFALLVDVCLYHKKSHGHISRITPHGSGKKEHGCIGNDFGVDFSLRICADGLQYSSFSKEAINYVPSTLNGSPDIVSSECLLFIVRKIMYGYVA